MITETFIAATEAVNKPSANLNSTLKDVGISHYEFQPQIAFRHGYKKSSVRPNCLAISSGHIFAAQANKAVIHVYNREKGNQEATVPFPDRIHSLEYADDAAILVVGTEDGKLILWEIASGRITTSSASHVEAVTSLAITKNNDHIISGSADSNLHVWSLAQLVGFASPSQPRDDMNSASSPLRTFSHHRDGITALALGHSRTSTNFAVSTSSDSTCFLWHIETCQILRTFLTPSIVSSIILDPADRAVYLASGQGEILSIDLTYQPGNGRVQSVYNALGIVPVQMKTTDYWSGQPSTYGAINCLTLNYDATNLLSGHADGTIVRWDVANRRLVSDIAHLQQPISSIQMLSPDGLLQLRRFPKSQYIIPTVVKPRLELNAEATDSRLGIPASYSLAVQITEKTAFSRHTSSAIRDTASVLAGSLFPEDMLTDAIEAMNSKNAGVVATVNTALSSSSLPKDPASRSTLEGNTDSNDDVHNQNDKYQIQSLEEEKVLLNKKLAVMQKLYNEIQERHRLRSERRDQISQKRREAYFAAKKSQKQNQKNQKNHKGLRNSNKNNNGNDNDGDNDGERAGDLAMKPFDEQLELIDLESDEEELKRAAELESKGK